MVSFNSQAIGLLSRISPAHCKLVELI